VWLLGFFSKCFWLDIDSLYRVCRGLAFLLAQSNVVEMLPKPRSACLDVATRTSFSGSMSAQHLAECGSPQCNDDMACVVGCPQWGSNTRATKGKRCDMRTKIDGAVLV
jgi:hypothetical protein